jgi:hypothetical protein
LVLLSSAACVRALALDRRLDRMLAFVTLGLAQIVASLLLAGVALQQLAAGPVLAVNAVMLAGSSAAALTRGRRKPRRTGGAAQPIAITASAVRANLWLLLLAGLAIGEIGWRLLIAYTLPPLGFDALWYHLTTVAGWLQAGKIVPSRLALWSAAFPANGEEFFTWPALFLRADRIVDAVQLGFAVIAGAAVVGIGRSVGLGRRAAVAAGLLFFLAPVVITESTVAYVDLILIASFLLAVYFMLRFLQAAAFTAGHGARDELDLRLVGLAGAAAGIALGIKTLGILYCGGLAALLAIQLVIAVARGRIRIRAATLALFWFLAPLVALGGFWYIRNWARYGNPVYPVKVELLGVTLFGGTGLQHLLAAPDYIGPWWKEVLSQWHRDQIPWSTPHYYPFDARPGGFGPLWSYLAAPALLVFALQMFRRNRWAFVNFLLPVAVVFLAQPYKWWSRFTMPLLADGTIALTYFVARAPPRIAAVAKTAVLVLVTAGLWYCSARIDRTITATRILRLATAPERSRTIASVAYPEFAWVDRVSRDARIGVDTTTVTVGSAPRVEFLYPLFGSHFDHRVYPLAGTSAARFRSYLTTSRLDYAMVATASIFGQFAEQAVQAGCLQQIAASTHPPTRTYRITGRCRTVAKT